MRVVWTKAADTNLQAIYDYIAQTSADYARRTIERITAHSQQIGTFPMAGRTVPEFQVGQLREVFEHPYRIIYRIRPDRLTLSPSYTCPAISVQVIHRKSIEGHIA